MWPHLARAGSQLRQSSQTTAGDGACRAAAARANSDVTAGLAVAATAWNGAVVTTIAVTAPTTVAAATADRVFSGMHSHYGSNQRPTVPRYRIVADQLDAQG